ncbi:hypothetical protein SO802_006199 [Lithocarpus litseifolius]|uniref:Uncharacterized protein n=1 Tax=Lithocarpus litseifolius TaxID=425828 RepID=A0AAW2DQT4_9ROSI
MVGDGVRDGWRWSVSAMVGDGRRWSPQSVGLRWFMVLVLLKDFGFVLVLWAEFDLRWVGTGFRWSGGFITSFLDLSFVEGLGFCYCGFVQLMLLVSCLTSVFSEEPYPPIPSPSHQHGHPPTPSEAPAHPPSRHHHHHHHHHHPPTHSPIYPPSHPPAHHPPHHAPPSHPPVHPPHQPPQHAPPSHSPVHPPSYPPHQPPQHAPPSHPPIHPPSHPPHQPPRHAPPSHPPVHPPSHPPHQPPQHAPPSHPPVHPPSHPPHQSPPSHPPVHPPAHPPSHPPQHAPPSHPPVYPPAHPPSFVAVQGVVYCKSCKYAGVDDLLGATPIDGAVVKLQCNNTKYPVVQTAKTDKNGYFFLTAPKTITSNVVNKCKVFLVSSPLTKCNKPSNLNDGLKGAILRPEISYVADKLPFILYTVGPFAFEPICLR